MRQHLYLSFFKNISANCLAKGYTGPAPISRIVTLCLFISSYLKKVFIFSTYNSTFVSIQSKSSLILIFGLKVPPHELHFGTNVATPSILSIRNGLLLFTLNYILLHFLHYQSKRLPLAYVIKF